MSNDVRKHVRKHVCATAAAGQPPATLDDQTVELLVQLHFTLVRRLQNLLPARSHDIRSHLDSTTFAMNLRAHCVPEPDVKSAVDFTWHMLRIAGASDMDRVFEEAHASILNARGERRICVFLCCAHEQLDMIRHTRSRRDATVRAALLGPVRVCE